MITEAIVGGVLLGLILAVMLGPLFFVLLKVSIHKGFLAGSLIAIGAIISDMILILLCYHGLMQLFNQESFSLIMGAFGGIVLLIMGIHTFIKKPIEFKISVVLNDLKTTSIGWMFLKGFIVNIINPFVIIFWAGIAGVMMLKDHYTSMDVSVFFISVLLTILITDIAKVYLAGRIRMWLKARYLFWINKLAGAGLIIFGLHLLSRIFLA